MERSCCCPCPAASFSVRKRLSIYLEKLSIMWSTSLTKKTDMWCRLTNENHPEDFWLSYERSSLYSGISSNKKDIAGEYYHQREKIKATPKNTELRDGRNIFLMTSFEALDPAMPEVTFTSKLDQLPFFSVNWAPEFLSFASECFLPPFPLQKSNAIFVPFIITIISLVL